MQKRNLRKPVATLILLAYLCLWIWASISIAPYASAASKWVELIFFIIAGTCWAIPLKPLFQWMNAVEPPPEDD